MLHEAAGVVWDLQPSPIWKSLAVKTFYDPQQMAQSGAVELINGNMVPCFERPCRVERIIEEVRRRQLGPILGAESFGLAPLHRVHAPSLVSFLRTAWDKWVAVHGKGDALPLSWIAPRMCRRLPSAIDGQLGHFCFDAGTPITGGTWNAVSASANVALSAAASVIKGDRAAFALCRPPGHHAGADYFGGYCFLNNAAIAAQAIRDRGVPKVAILDVDYHHGNGTQDIFYARADVLFVSIHADPSLEFPFFSGHSDERGSSDGLGFNLNLPLRLGSTWVDYLPALKYALATVAQFKPDALVISLGVDTYEGDPISRFQLTSDDFFRLGAQIASVNLPSLFILEGGYALGALGTNVVNTLDGFAAVCTN